MSKYAIAFPLMILLSMSITAPSHAETGLVRISVAKAGLIIGAGAGRGVLIFHGREYRFRIVGLTVGLTAGATTGRFEGHASHLHHVRDFAGTYTGAGLGGAWVAGAGGARWKNDKGVIITLEGGEVGLELAANLSGVRIEFEHPVN
jgi:hypothetical protein